jgi:hypothetical protein
MHRRNRRDRTPDQHLALVANSLDWVKDGEGWKGVPDNKIYVIGGQSLEEKWREGSEDLFRPRHCRLSQPLHDHRAGRPSVLTNMLPSIECAADAGG